MLHYVDLPLGETIAYRTRAGGDKTILLIHGNMVSSKHWDLLLDNLDEQYTLVPLDLPGFGQSTYNHQINSIEDFAKVVKEFVDELELDVYAILGWSMGGAIGMQYCAMYDQPCEKLMLLASGSTRGYPFYATNPDGTPDVSNRLETYDQIKQDPMKTKVMEAAQQNGDKETMKMVWDAAIYTQKKPEPNHYDEYLEDILTQRNIAECYHALNHFNISHVHNGLVDGTGDVDQIDVPVLVMHGDLDYVVLSTMKDEILEDLTGDVEYVELTNCGHSPMVDDLSLLTESIENYLRKD
ncbi:intracellular short-chain-length polyhydroxyalkanoate depolymerase [Alkalibacillus haloalkaliphilus]|uniref:3-oxoadipate enol-lactonase n=1 Tax=Alkalibacillus haloalkaliphilus TaxID=94136 RepID=A0A511W131_9BACI|nr:alpha/beta hydrolase [Alkalibacillus haloalkaliphilus]GEN44799.1 3-oxoadipate enol-lactonase [Alkalibacillus haloalkaliphilus]